MNHLLTCKKNICMTLIMNLFLVYIVNGLHSKNLDTKYNKQNTGTIEPWSNSTEITNTVQVITMSRWNTVSQEYTVHTKGSGLEVRMRVYEEKKKVFLHRIIIRRCRGVMFMSQTANPDLTLSWVMLVNSSYQGVSSESHCKRKFQSDFVIGRSVSHGIPSGFNGWNVLLLLNSLIWSWLWLRSEEDCFLSIVIYEYVTFADK